MKIEVVSNKTPSPEELSMFVKRFLEGEKSISRSFIDPILKEALEAHTLSNFNFHFQEPYTKLQITLDFIHDQFLNSWTYSISCIELNLKFYTPKPFNRLTAQGKLVIHFYDLDSRDSQEYNIPIVFRNYLQ